MINRSHLKYKLKKLLPKTAFEAILFMWRNFGIHVAEIIDALRVQSFRKEVIKKLTHKDHSFLLYLSPLNGFIDRHIYLYGVYEPFILDIISDHLHKGDVFIDIGSNIGQHSIFAATCVGSAGKVYSYEPIPKIYSQMKRSIHANHLEHVIIPINVALGNENKEQMLHISKNAGGSSLLNENEETIENISVQIQKGDEALQDLPRVSMIKIDVEGYEYSVLLGIRETLSQKRPTILLEYSGEFYAKQTANDGQNILKLLRELRYDLFDIEDSMKTIEDDEVFNVAISKIRKQTNLLCLPRP